MQGMIWNHGGFRNTGRVRFLRFHCIQISDCTRNPSIIEIWYKGKASQFSLWCVFRNFGVIAYYHYFLMNNIMASKYCTVGSSSYSMIVSSLIRAKLYLI